MRKLIAVCMLLALVLGTACAEDRGEFYPLLTIVIDVINDTDEIYIILCEDMSGNVWQFYDEENFWKVGDLCNLLMWNMGGPQTEDEIIEVYYEGNMAGLLAR